MSRTRIIYFLSAFVLIIGCFALNQSYSMFTDTEESEPITAEVPALKAALSISNIKVEAGKEYLIKQTVTNNSVVPINFGIKTDYPNNVSMATHSSITDNLSYGIIGETDTSLPANTSKDIYLIVSNIDGTEDITINFELEFNYTTISITTEELSNISVSKEVAIEEANVYPYSDKPETLTYKIIENFVNSDLYNPVTTVDESEEENNTISISDIFGESNKVLYPVKISKTSELNVPSPTTFTGVETEEVGLYQADDDYGTSYYFRGASSINYVSFAGFTWRIVRINGDGSIRLILDGTLDKVTKDGETSAVYTNSKLRALDNDGIVAFKSSPYNDNAYVGYMYGDFKTNSSTYDDAHENIKDSTIKTYIDTFYEEYLIDYESYLADTLFCADKTRASGYTTLGYGKNATLYSVYDRIISSSSEATPTLKCASSEFDVDANLTEEERSYSRYTSKIDESTTTSKGVLVNNDLKYPIALLSADELVMAGAFTSKKNQSYYLYDAYVNKTSYSTWWTMSPYCFFGSYASEFYGSATSDSLDYSGVHGYRGSRPVINLSSDVLWVGGDGTSGEGAYTVSLPN